MSQIVENLKRIMDQKNISINSLEKKDGVKASAVQNIIYGRSKSPGVDTLISIAQALECSVYDLIGDIAGVTKRKPLESKWDMELYVKSVNAIYKTTREMELELSREDFLFCAYEVFKYSIMSSNKDIDLNFVHWILEQKS